MTTRLRVIFTVAALAAGVWFLSGAAAAPVLPPGTYKKTAEADIAQLQKHLEVCVKPETPADVRRYAPTAKSVAMMLALYGEATGDKALKDGAAKVAEAVANKDYKAAADAAKDLKVKAAGKALPPGMLHTDKKIKYSLDEVMSPFRSGNVGGLNIEKDIRDFMNAKMPIDTAAIEVLAGRTAVIGDYAVHFPNEKADVNPQNRAKWVKWSKDTTELANKIAAEAGKGKGANEKELIKLLKGLDGVCIACHNEFRD